MDVDGQDNTVYEVNTEAVPPGGENPHGNAYFARVTPISSEAEGGRNVEALSARYWKVLNESSRNILGEPVAYKLMPKSNVLPFAQPDAQVTKRAGLCVSSLASPKSCIPTATWWSLSSAAR
jgi:primary-amine oxidase